MKFYFVCLKVNKCQILKIKQVKELMIAFPKLDRMMCETLLKISPESLKSYMEEPERSNNQPEDSVLKSVEIT